MNTAPLVSRKFKRNIGLTVNGIIAQIPTIILWFVGKDQLIEPRKIQELLGAASDRLQTLSSCPKLTKVFFAGTRIWLVGNDNNNSIDTTNNNVIAKSAKHFRSIGLF